MSARPHPPAAPIVRFSRQYLQLEPSPQFPDDHLLRQDATQVFLFKNLFAPDALTYAPPLQYQLRILKELVARIEASIDDWEQYGISDDLVTSLSSLLSRPLPPEVIEAQQRCYVTYHQSTLEQNPPSDSTQDPQITLLESRAIIAAGGTTGLRTWEASLHLGNYLCKNPSLIRGRRILELGAGTGYLSILCAKHLDAEHVVASDGSDDVIHNLPDSLFLNGLQGSAQVVPMDLKWGHALVGTEEQEWNGGRRVDLVIGADITYDQRLIPSLVGTLQELSDMFTNAEIVISATERNIQTFEKFLNVAQHAGYHVEYVDFPVTARENQMGPFYDDRTPIHICKLARKTLRSGFGSMPSQSFLTVVWES